LLFTPFGFGPLFEAILQVEQLKKPQQLGQVIDRGQAEIKALEIAVQTLFSNLRKLPL